MKIFIIGQTSLHWGRMEFGNIGNYYIIEPFIRELHKTFPNAIINTTLQMSDRFCKDENINLVPLDLYFGWEQDNLSIALRELEIAKTFSKTSSLIESTPYIDEVRNSDLVIDFSGDIWGDNANFLGKDRFLVGLLKNRIAQLLNKKTAMLAGSPGPFTNKKTKEFAKEVYKNFDLVTNRESISTQLLKKEGFDISKTKSLACPAFLFEQKKGDDIDQLIEKEILSKADKKKVGFILCGWNFLEGPFDKKNRDDDDFIPFAEIVEYISEELNLEVFLMSHSNGFPRPPEKFKLIHGRDYYTARQLKSVIDDRAIAKNVHFLNGVYDSWESKAIIGKFDLLVSGRIHAAVAALSQSVPTIIMDYGHEPKAHKLEGFVNVADIKDYFADPFKMDDFKNKIFKCYNERSEIKNQLKKTNLIIQNKVKNNFVELKNLFL